MCFLGGTLGGLPWKTGSGASVCDHGGLLYGIGLALVIFLLTRALICDTDTLTRQEETAS